MNITIIGAGNLGYHLAQRLTEVGHSIVQIFSRHTNKATRIARIIQAQPIDNLASLQAGADLYLIAVSDDAVGAVAGKMRKRIPESSRVAHCSGTLPSTVLADHFKEYGVLYPLQTFSISRMPDFSRIPVLVDASSREFQDQLLYLAETISPKSQTMDDAQRAVLHLGAVFVNNFSNHLYAVAEEILSQHGLGMNLLHPLIEETARKVGQFSAKEAQTGPAARGDMETIERHLAALASSPEYRKIYELMTEGIRNAQPRA